MNGPDVFDGFLSYLEDTALVTLTRDERARSVKVFNAVDYTGNGLLDVGEMVSALNATSGEIAKMLLALCEETEGSIALQDWLHFIARAKKVFGETDVPIPVPNTLDDTVSGTFSDLIDYLETCVGQSLNSKQYGQALAIFDKVDNNSNGVLEAWELVEIVQFSEDEVAQSIIGLLLASDGQINKIIWLQFFNNVKSMFGDKVQDLLDYLHTCPKVVLSSKQYSVAVELFRAIDRDSSGSIDMAELDAVLRTSTGRMHEILSKMVGYGIMNLGGFLQFLADVKLGYDDFTCEAVMHQLATSARAAMTEAEEGEVRELYKLMDANCDGTLDRNEVLFMLRHSKGAVVKDLVNHVNEGRGEISPPDFLAALSFVKMKRGGIAFRGILDYLRKVATEGVQEEVLIAELESGWGSTDGGPSKPPAIIVSVLKPALVAKLGRPGLRQLFVKKIHATGRVSSAAKQDHTINPETKLWAGGMSTFCGQMWNMHSGSGVEMGDTLLHIAARSMNQQAVRFLVDQGLELSRRNAAGMVPYDCVKGTTAAAEQTREEFPADWVARYQTMSPRKKVAEPMVVMDEVQAAQVEDDFFAAIQTEFASAPPDPKEEIRKRNAAIRVAREEERRRALGKHLPSAVLATATPNVVAATPETSFVAEEPEPLPLPSESSAKVAQVVAGLRSELSTSKGSPKKSSKPKKKMTGTVKEVEAWKSRLAKEDAAARGAASGRRVYRFAHQ